MERFVFIAAVTIAIIFGIGAVFGGPNHGWHWEFNDDDDFGGAEAVMQVAAGRMETQTFQGTELRIKHSAAMVTITPEDRSDITVEIDNPGLVPMPTVSTDGGAVVIDGHLRGRISGCRDDGVNVRGYSNISREQMPRVTIHVPRALEVSLSGANQASIGPAESVEADLSGCGNTTIGDVAGALSIDASGSGDVTAGSAQSLDVDLAGSGEISIGAVANGADLDIAGSGEVTIASLSGDLDADAAGSGTVRINGGSIGSASVELAGSGDVDVTAPVRALDVDIVGSGDVSVNAAVGDLDAEIAGSGSVDVDSVTGNTRRQVFGSGEVRVGQSAAPSSPPAVTPPAAPAAPAPPQQ
ncbi:GIN domain-containing protein [Terricaulis sp.]|uniref:GIN domain-containing protein n=1 Tax=Terricaulis sp. TaxID=2768686 RepID=UPI003782E29C